MSLTEFPQVESLAQFSTFVIAFVLGAFFCLLYDLFRSVRASFPHKNLVIFFEDIFFWAICSILYFCFALVRCEGQIRIYCIIGCALGAILCRVTLSRVVFKILNRFFGILKSVVEFMQNKIVLPIGRQLTVILHFVQDFFRKLAVWSTKFSKKHLQKRSKVVYNHKKKKSKVQGEKTRGEKQKQKNKR